eukprot:TRINITY_DN761_c0_g1_i1.p1 TRINITY_DN761_c0_g1~~TRINITY_DN761_c0_g1_i1.p1  ORF type:complete len:379 (+),score=106.95 TRINITY_DN761_c0_g1_i1:239-1375(+)
MANQAPAFSTSAEEIAYWKGKLEEKQLEYDELEASFSEFQEFSKQLEEELEQDSTAAEKRHAELLASHSRLKADMEVLQEKHAKVLRESSAQIHTLQEEVQKYIHLKNELQSDVRRLEQENDTLERRERQASATNQDLSERLDKAIEENVWLQSELDEQKTLSLETIQRLREEIRDLKLEMSINQERYGTVINSSNNSIIVDSPNKNDSSQQTTQTIPPSPRIRPKLPTLSFQSAEKNSENTQANSSIQSTSPAPQTSFASKRENYLLSPRSPRPLKSPRTIAPTHSPLSLNQIGKLTPADAVKMVMDMMTLVKELEDRLSAYRHTRSIIPDHHLTNEPSPSLASPRSLAGTPMDTALSAPMLSNQEPYRQNNGSFRV